VRALLAIERCWQSRPEKLKEVFLRGIPFPSLCRAAGGSPIQACFREPGCDYPTGRMLSVSGGLNSAD
jgi:hypothetical protein